MTHDAMWLANNAKQIGIDATNMANKTSMQMMARTEAKRIKQVLEVENPKSFEGLKQFIQTGFEIIRGRFMTFHLEFDEPDTICLAGALLFCIRRPEANETN